MSATRTVDTVCGYCGVGCGLTLDIDAHGVLTSRGTPDHPANHGRLCTKGTTTADLLRAGGRQTTALLHGRPVSTDEAVSEIAARFTDIRCAHGDDAVALYVSGQMSTEAQYLANKLAKGHFRTNLIESNSRLCMASAATGYKQSLGADGPPGSYDDIDHADVFLVAGANMADCHPVLFLRLMDRVRQGAKLIVVDPRRTATAKKADLHLAVRPGTDMALLNGLLRLVVDAGDTDRAFIDEFTDGWEDMAGILADYPADTVSEITGVPVEDLRTAASWIGGTRKFVSLWTMGLNQSVHGTWHTTALCNLHLATGAICRTGAGPFSLTGQPNAMGGREMGYMGPGLPGQRTVLDPGDRAEVERIWQLPPGTLHTRLGGGTVDLFRALDSGDVRAVWVICTNPAASVANRDRVTAALDAADYVVVQDAYAGTETAAHADAVLPAAMWSETPGVMVNSERGLTLTRPVADPPGEALADWELICRVAREMGFPGFDFSCAAEVFDEIRKFHNPRTGWDLRGVDHRRLSDGPVQWPAAPGCGPRNPVRYLNNGVSQRLHVTPDGRVPRLAFPTPDRRARFIPRPFLPLHEEPDADFPFILTTGRLPHQWHTMTKTGRVSKLMKLNPSSFVQVSNVDAVSAGICDGDLVEVTSRRGKVSARALVSDDTAPGTLFIPMHYRDTPVNTVTSDAVDPESLQPAFKACAVSVKVIETAPAPGGGRQDATEPGARSGQDGEADDGAVTVVWASQTGTVEDHVPAVVSALSAAGIPARARCAESVGVRDLAGTVLFIVSSTGDGEAPDNATALWDLLTSADHDLSSTRYSVLGFGDSSYADFCGFARRLDTRLAELGAEATVPRASCEPDFETTASEWVARVIGALGGDAGAVTSTGPRATGAATPAGTGQWSRRNPLTTRLSASTRLTAGTLEETGREVRRYTFDLPPGTLTYSVGDALGIWPRNDPSVVAEFLARTGMTPTPDLVESLTGELDITSVSPQALRLIDRHCPAAGLGALAGDAQALRTFSHGRQLCDVLASFPVTAGDAEWLEALPALRPRLYSISSSPLTDPGKVEVTVSTVGFTSTGGYRRGVCSGWLAGLSPGDPVRLFISPNRRFCPPERPDAPMIMIGPGTGVAPFRGFLHERRGSGATGKNWLFYGERHEATDFLYRDEFTTMNRDGTLTRLSTAFSRDQAEKVYVQDRMRDQGRDLWEWIDRGAHVYVCGDAARMARDVDRTLRRIIAEQGGMGEDEAGEFVARMSAEHRYVRDVY
ncbi:bifunctional nitrate reductase/sulfite reductase flavoprotein subunit alpha [Corynebacterium provencense]|uniref:bifunctional nitrate reductase/sulfite reductase flavoprotein subunit alpha n=1 Tax=Corynebacterium provencense TaxID=1737425 RepID=UPI000837280C|nr:bifunctional nitrate reductase/sulfite reductase flavoprotein subunit alpha [Corynebacterium provencense]